MRTLREYKLNWTLSDKVTAQNSMEKMLLELVGEMANDKNSSKFREDVTKYMLGLEGSESKMGYDDDEFPIEVKPQNFSGTSKLNGGGSFSDFTWRRSNKYTNDGAVIVVSGFAEGKVLYVVQFPYEVVRPKIEQALRRHLPKGDQPNRYVRTASFSWRQWRDSMIDVVFVRDNIHQYKHTMVKGLYKLLTEQKEN